MNLLAAVGGEGNLDGKERRMDQRWSEDGARMERGKRKKIEAFKGIRSVLDREMDRSKRAFERERFRPIQSHGAN